MFANQSIRVETLSSQLIGFLPLRITRWLAPLMDAQRLRLEAKLPKTFERRSRLDFAIVIVVYIKRRVQHFPGISSIGSLLICSGLSTMTYEKHFYAELFKTLGTSFTDVYASQPIRKSGSGTQVIPGVNTKVDTVDLTVYNNPFVRNFLKDDDVVVLGKKRPQQQPIDAQSLAKRPRLVTSTSTFTVTQIAPYGRFL